MLDFIKNDPLIKSIVVILLGIVGFGFAFNVMFGSSGIEHGTMLGNPLSNSLSYILNISIKLFLIVMVFTVIFVLVKFIKTNLFERGDKEMFEMIKNDPLIKIVSVVLITVIILIILTSLIGNIFGMGNGFGMMYGGMYGSYGFGLSGLLVVLAKFLIFISFAGVLIGLTMYFKEQYFDKAASSRVEPQREAVCTDICTNCGKEMKTEWKCCPYCGIDAVTNAVEKETKEETDEKQGQA